MWIHGTFTTDSLKYIRLQHLASPTGAKRMVGRGRADNAPDDGAQTWERLALEQCL